MRRAYRCQTAGNHQLRPRATREWWRRWSRTHRQQHFLAVARGSQAWWEPGRRGGWLAYGHSLVGVGRVARAVR
jgi:hypothetical protein